jgi:hypothetical protein
MKLLILCLLLSSCAAPTPFHGVCKILKVKKGHEPVIIPKELKP